MVAVLGAAHAGWRGLEAGVLGATVRAMRDLGAGAIRAVLGPCISPGAYEFSGADLDRLCEVLGEEVRGVTDDGRPALDVPAAVHSSLLAEGVVLDRGRVRPACTAASDRLWSHRRTADTARQAGVIWWEEVPDGS